MIISVAEIKQLITFPDNWTDEKIKRKLLAIEQIIRKYTHNNFQNPKIRVCADISDPENSELVTDDPIRFIVGNTVQISESCLNAGLYEITGIDEDAGTITVAEDLMDEMNVRVTKVEYPADVVECCVNLMEWEATMREKVGIKSETLSRHSVTYYDQDVNNQVMGYPASMLGCLKAYKKARF